MFSSGIYLNRGKVVAVTPSGAEVRAQDGTLMQFDANGRETDAGRRDRLGFGPSPDSRFHTAAHIGTFYRIQFASVCAGSRSCKRVHS